jgi:hypothetical protein
MVVLLTVELMHCLIFPICCPPNYLFLTILTFQKQWNPQSDAQAMARVHRIGQTKTVHVSILGLCRRSALEVVDPSIRILR